MGLFAARAIEKGMRIVRYTGERVSKEESLRRKKERGAKHIYSVALDEDWEIDGDNPQNDARFANHSCAANCELILEEGELWLKAARDISANEELCFDYGFSLAEALEHPCRCGAKNCAGFIVAEPSRKWLRRKVPNPRKVFD